MDDCSSRATGGTVGIDLGDRYSQICVLDAAGAVLEEGRVPTTPLALRCRFQHLPRSLVAIETGGDCHWVQGVLQECGHEVLVANARKLRLIFKSESKSDRFDAETLARVARMDRRLLSPIQLRGEEAQADLASLRSRDVLVRLRTSLVNHVRGTLKSAGIRPQACSARSFHKRAPEMVPPSLRPALDPVIEMLALLGPRISDLDDHIAQLTRERYPETERLLQVPGVGPITALCFVLTVEDPRRFKNGRAVAAYLGLRPRRRQSGARDPELRITKAGDTHLRWLLVSAAHYIMGPFGPDTDLRRWGQSLAARGGKNAKKRAVVAVARKLAVLLYRLWVSGEPYQAVGHPAPRRRRRRRA